MKELKNVFLVLLIASFVLALLLRLLVGSMLSLAPNWLDAVLLSAFGALFMSGALSFSIYSFLKPKLKYLDSEEAEVPPFGDKLVRIIPVEVPNFSFEVVKYRIKEQYLITQYDDIEKYMVKFRSGFGVGSWGVAGCVVYDEVAKTMTLTCFPLTAYTEKSARLAQTTIDKVEGLIRNK